MNNFYHFENGGFSCYTDYTDDSDSIKHDKSKLHISIREKNYTQKLIKEANKFLSKLGGKTNKKLNKNMKFARHLISFKHIIKETRDRDIEEIQDNLNYVKSVKNFSNDSNEENFQIVKKCYEKSSCFLEAEYFLESEDFSFLAIKGILEEKKVNIKKYRAFFKALFEYIKNHDIQEKSAQEKSLCDAWRAIEESARNDSNECILEKIELSLDCFFSNNSEKINRGNLTAKYTMDLFDFLISQFVSDSATFKSDKNILIAELIIPDVFKKRLKVTKKSKERFSNSAQYTVYFNESISDEQKAEIASEIELFFQEKKGVYPGKKPDSDLELADYLSFRQDHIMADDYVAAALENENKILQEEAKKGTTYNTIHAKVVPLKGIFLLPQNLTPSPSTYRTRFIAGGVIMGVGALGSGVCLFAQHSSSEDADNIASTLAVAWPIALSVFGIGLAVLIICAVMQSRQASNDDDSIEYLSSIDDPEQNQQFLIVDSI